MRTNCDLIAILFIAVAVYLVFRAFHESPMLTPSNMLFYFAIAASLMASNVPRLINFSHEARDKLRFVEYLTLAVAIGCFVALCLEHTL